MISSIAPAGTEASEERGWKPEKGDKPRARAEHAILSDPSNPTSGDAVGVRERMLRATLKLIAEGGVAAVTNRRVATAGAPVGPAWLTNLG